MSDLKCWVIRLVPCLAVLLMTGVPSTARSDDAGGVGGGFAKGMKHAWHKHHKEHKHAAGEVGHKKKVEHQQGKADKDKAQHAVKHEEKHQPGKKDNGPGAALNHHHKHHHHHHHFKAGMQQAMMQLLAAEQAMAQQKKQPGGAIGQGKPGKGNNAVANGNNARGNNGPVNGAPPQPPKPQLNNGLVHHHHGHGFRGGMIGGMTGAKMRGLQFPS